MNNKIVLAAVALSLMMSGSAVMAKGSLSAQDKTWLKGAHQVNLAEIKAGQTAYQRAHSGKVRQVGQVLVQDHQMLDSKLTKTARMLKLPLPNEIPAEDKAKMHATQGKHGMAFDKAWVHMEVDGHISAIRKTEKEITEGQSQKVVKLAKSALPVLKKHLHMLKMAAKDLRGEQ